MDQYLINRFQDGCDYLWNNYGITRGYVQIAFLMVCLARSLNNLFAGDTMPWIILPILGIFIGMAIRESEKQGEGKFDKINKDAMEEQTRVSNYVLRYFIIVLTMFSVAKGVFYSYDLNLFATISSLSFAGFLYARTVLVRNRKIAETHFAFSNGV